ncbi:MAG: CopG family transcriptional regulator [Oscillospiraceae bacterium]|nr:CopG family transcriptional regulator [Oscillospiraceae bacterium]
MAESKFQITPKKYIGESSVVSLRMPKDMLRDIDEIAAKTGRTRNEFMLMSLEFALDHLEIEEK